MSSRIPRRDRGRQLDHSEALLAWRTHQLKVAGLSERQAVVLLASGDVDVHAVLELMDRGCPPWLAARIMAPLDAELPRDI